MFAQQKGFANFEARPGLLLRSFLAQWTTKKVRQVQCAAFTIGNGKQAALADDMPTLALHELISPARFITTAAGTG